MILTSLINCVGSATARFTEIGKLEYMEKELVCGMDINFTVFV